MPSRLPAVVRERLDPIRALVLDVDGDLTDGILLYGSAGEAVKQFSVRDGLAIRLLLDAGFSVAVVTRPALGDHRDAVPGPRPPRRARDPGQP